MHSETVAAATLASSRGPASMETDSALRVHGRLLKGVIHCDNLAAFRHLAHNLLFEDFCIQLASKQLNMALM